MGRLALEGILRSGRRSGELTFDETPARLSRMIFNTLQGALLVKRSTDDLSQLQDVIKATDDLSQLQDVIKAIKRMLK
jgi:virulence-associated protein VapD